MTINKLKFPSARVDSKTGQVSVSHGSGYKNLDLFSHPEVPGAWLNAEGKCIEKYNGLSFEDLCHKEKWHRL